jgi:hypothetical protein
MAYTTRFSAANTGVKASKCCKGWRTVIQRDLACTAPSGRGDTVATQLAKRSACACAAFTASPSPRGRSRTCNVRAQAAADGADIARRAMLSSAVALGAATMLPYAAPMAAQANTVLSSDWEQVNTWQSCCCCF